MARKCPLCERDGRDGTLQKREYGICCNKLQFTRNGKDYESVGECNFRINYEQKSFGKRLSDGEIRTLLDGGEIKNKDATMKLNLDRDGFFTEITWKEKNYSDFN